MAAELPRSVYRRTDEKDKRGEGAQPGAVVAPSPRLSRSGSGDAGPTRWSLPHCDRRGAGASPGTLIDVSFPYGLPDLDAGCSLADSCPADAFEKFIHLHPNHTVITYVNCSAEVKALSDIICTSANAKKVIESLPKDEPILFGPDKNLGKYLINETGRDLVLWQGACMVHEAFSVDKLKALSKQFPNAEIVAHPESETPILEMANYIGSTSGMINYIKKSDCPEFIIATEAGILHQMKMEVPGKLLIPAPAVENNTCACSECPYMKMNTLEKLYQCLRDETPEVNVPELIREKALIPLKRMLEISA